MGDNITEPNYKKWHLSFFAVIVDEVTDKPGNKEVLSVCITNVDVSAIKEQLLDFVHLKRTTGESIAIIGNSITEVLQNAHLDVKKIKGQA